MKTMQIEKSTVNKLTLLKEAMLSPSGEEINNPQGMDIPIGLNRPESLKSQIQRLMRVELSNQASEQEFETFEESQDFDVHDSFEQERAETQYEIMEDDIPLPPTTVVTEGEPKPSAPETSEKIPIAPPEGYETPQKTPEQVFIEAQKPLPLEPKS